MIEVKPAAELGESARRRIAGVYADAFADDFSYFTPDTARLAAAFEHMFVLDLFHVALVDGEPAGIAACTDGRQHSVRPDGRHLRRHLGPVKGSIAAYVFKREFARETPEPADGTASIEFVGTAPAYQGKGVATALIRHLLALPEYHTYLLDDVSDINAAALGLYAKLGFTECARQPVRHTRRTGISYYVSMKLVQG